MKLKDLGKAWRWLYRGWGGKRHSGWCIEGMHNIMIKRVVLPILYLTELEVESYNSNI